MKKEWKKVLYYVIGTVITACILAGGKIVAQKANIKTVLKIELESKQRDETIKKDFNNFETKQLELSRSYDEKLDRHQQQIIENNNQMYKQIITLIRQSK